MTTTLEQLLTAAEEAKTLFNRYAGTAVNDISNAAWDDAETNYVNATDRLKAELSAMGIDADRLVRVLR